MELTGYYVQHKFSNEISPSTVQKVENSRAIFDDGSFWFADNCIAIEIINNVQYQKKDKK